MDARCPHCANVFPTETTGVQFCPSCGQQVNVAHVGPTPPASTPSGYVPPGPSFLPPASPPPGPPSGAPPLGGQVAWERRHELGLFQAFWLTFKESLFNPAGFWPTVRPGGPWMDAMLYAWLCGAVGTILALPLRLVQAGQQKELLKNLGDLDKQLPQLRQALELMTDAGPGVALVTTIGSILILPIGLLIGAAVFHLGCLIVGANTQGFWATFRAYGYATGPSLVSFIPCVNFLAAIYQLVLFGMGLKQLHGTSNGKATAAVLVPIAALSLCCCCIPLLVVVFAAAAAGAK